MTSHHAARPAGEGDHDGGEAGGMV
jgi:hypothetical protein